MHELHHIITKGIIPNAYPKVEATGKAQSSLLTRGLQHFALL
jgi:hypothetical protein